MDYWDEQLSPRPDTHGVKSYPIDSTMLVLPYGDQHGQVSYPIDSSGDVLPKADNHDNSQFAMHPGQAKPGSFKEQQKANPAGSYNVGSPGTVNAVPGAK